MTRGEISVGDLTSLLLYTVYVGSGLQMLTYVILARSAGDTKRGRGFPTGLSLYVLNCLVAPACDPILLIQSSIMRGIGAGTRIFDLLDRRPAIPPTSGITLDPIRRGTIKFEKITFEYPSRKDVEILHDFSLEIRIGESVAIV